MIINLEEGTPFEASGNWGRSREPEPGTGAGNRSQEPEPGTGARNQIPQMGPVTWVYMDLAGFAANRAHGLVYMCLHGICAQGHLFHSSWPEYKGVF